MLVYPTLSKRYQGNLQCAGSSFLQERQLELAKVIEEALLSSPAGFVCKITNDVTQATLENPIADLTRISDKSNIHFLPNSLPPMSIIVTGWTDVETSTADFKFGLPSAVRQLADKVIENLLVIYLRRMAKDNPDHGLEVILLFE